MEAKEFKGLMEAYASVYEQTEVLSEETLEEKKIATETGKKVMPSAKERSALAKRARAGKDIGKKGKGFEAVAAKAAKQYGSKEAGERVAAAAMFKQQAKEEFEIEEERREPDLDKMKRQENRHQENAVQQRGGSRGNSKNRAMKMSGIRNALERGEDPRADTYGGARTARGNAPEDHRAGFSKNPLNNPPRRVKEPGVKKEEVQTDVFDAILEHLVAEGYADTNQAALAIMANMSEEWMQGILEEADPIDVDYPTKRLPNGRMPKPTPEQASATADALKLRARARLKGV